MKAISSHPSPGSSVSPLPPSLRQPSTYLHTALMPLIGLLPCRLNNPNSFIFLPRWCFPNLWWLSLPSLWTPSSWLLTVLYPKLGAEPLPMPSGWGISDIFSTYPRMMLLLGGSSLCNPFTHSHAVLQARIRFGSSGAGALSHAKAGMPAAGWEPRHAGEGGQSHQLSTAPAAQLPGERKGGHTGGWFPLVVWEPAVIF